MATGCMSAGGEEMPDAAGVDGRVGRGRRMGVGRCTNPGASAGMGVWPSDRRLEASWVLAVERWLSLIEISVWTELLEHRAVQLRLGVAMGGGFVLKSTTDDWKWSRWMKGRGVGCWVGWKDASLAGRSAVGRCWMARDGWRMLRRVIGSWRWLMGSWLLLDGVGRDDRGVAGWNGSSAVELGEYDDGAPYWCSVEGHRKTSVLRLLED
ncbi:hypothetical protein ACLOJK_041862 [Asimina triloba]